MVKLTKLHSSTLSEPISALHRCLQEQATRATRDHHASQALWSSNKVGDDARTGARPLRACSRILRQTSSESKHQSGWPSGISAARTQLSSCVQL